jgi:hypothetical protein
MISSLISVLCCAAFAFLACVGRQVGLAFFYVVTSLTVTTLKMIDPTLFSSNEYAGFSTAIINAINIFALGYLLVITRTNQKS